MSVEPIHPECLECKFFNPNRRTARCSNCGAGEFFEEKIADREMNPDELMQLFCQMSFDSDD